LPKSVEQLDKIIIPKIKYEIEEIKKELKKEIENLNIRIDSQS
jgi:hypothetical protein